MNIWTPAWEAYTKSTRTASDLDSFEFWVHTMRVARRGLTREDAARILGVPVNADEATIRKVWRQKTIENHPDRGGSVEAMAQINVAAETLLGQGVGSDPPPPSPRRRPGEPTEEQRREWEERRKREEAKKKVPPPDPQGGSFTSAASKGSGVDWKIISENSYRDDVIRDDETAPGWQPGEEVPATYWRITRSWVLFGVKNGQGVMMGLVYRRNQRGNPGSNPGATSEAWEAVVRPVKGDPRKVLPKTANAFLGEHGYVGGRVKWGLLDGSVPKDPNKVPTRLTLPKALEIAGFAKPSKRRKPLVVIEVARKPNFRDIAMEIRNDNSRPWHKAYTFTVTVDGKGRDLSDDEVHRLSKSTFLLAVFSYDYEKKSRIDLTAIRKYPVTYLLSNLSDNLSPSPLRNEVDQALKFFQESGKKTASVIARWKAGVR